MTSVNRGIGSRLVFNLTNGYGASATAMQDRSGRLFFVFDDCLPVGRMVYNTAITENHNWASSSIRSWLHDEGLKLLPDTIQKLIVPTEIVQVSDGKPVHTNDMLFLLSHTQVFGGERYADQEPNDSILSGFMFPKDRISFLGGYLSPYWLRTVSNVYGTPAALTVSVFGCGGFEQYAHYDCGVRPAFCVDQEHINSKNPIRE